MAAKRVKRGHFDLNVLLYRQDDMWTAHCLEFDLVAQEPSIETSLHTLANKMISYVKFAVENDWEEDMIRMAPAEYWYRLWQTKRRRMFPETINPRLRSIPRIDRVAVGRIPANA